MSPLTSSNIFFGPAPVMNSKVSAVVAIAASAGGLHALVQILSALPADFPAAGLVVQHLDPRHRSLLAEILGRSTALHVEQAKEGDRLRAGTFYIAPPNHHMTLNPDDAVCLSSGQPVHFVRPAADVLFESVATSCGDRAIAVVLTGTGCDGADGVRAVKQHGGTVIAQDEATSEFFAMPSAAIRTGCVGLVLPLQEIAPRLMALAGSAHDG